ncbi:peptidyl-prolyl cis-trans isomerase, FKBP-type family protein [Trichomonas vaginalis G3]|uniref:peptidylprolyl isomerase n=1 Tax=Trichomonas vaginalis (strain ATCC PRA-98 / G3) TaxID=412133 RepID=A2G763_TRIV3|nr:peptidyl-prolyl cis-trans isomerase protein [Trichomonas vaginalis G3]EAX87003.1 peptidyl-prolyl cis-trans isomerase, FKBP-type family protein [Trichomonas vaginalis G3]KAI5485251.1 peptidyl-prolyl cis-trans isomerase protein [Trichomonas vaginalis G3]|eukprot:XP_001299933.1 peptidyl-prolyl cis-trans isomerase, FKBP-type family protein [Trichomonas vaginalis G3]
MGFLLLFYLIKYIISLQANDSRLKIGIIKAAPNCDRWIEDGNWIYAHIVARVEGRDEPVLNTYNDKPMYLMVNNSKFIPGFNIGLRGACEFETRRITIPPELAYGDKFVDGLFGPQATWTVDAEILEILKDISI